MTAIRRGLLWTAAALLGIALAAALTWSVSRLAGQRIGLVSAPLSVTEGLAPPLRPPVPPAGRRGKAARTDPPHSTSPGQSAQPATAAALRSSPTSTAAQQPTATPGTGASGAGAGVGAVSTAPQVRAPSGQAAAAPGFRSAGGADHPDDSSGGSGGSHSGRDD